MGSVETLLEAFLAVIAHTIAPTHSYTVRASNCSAAAPKVGPLAPMASALATQPLAQHFLFSSVASLIGAQGQVSPEFEAELYWAKSDKKTRALWLHAALALSPESAGQLRGCQCHPGCMG